MKHVRRIRRTKEVNDTEPIMPTLAHRRIAEHDSCSEQGEAAAYLDGELSLDAALDFERHIAACGACRRSVSEQRRTLATLDAAFERNAKLTLPADFSRRLTARARADVGVVRSGAERRRALAICLLLGAASLLLLGTGTAGGISPEIEAALAPVASLARLVAQVSSDFVHGACALLRVAGGGVRHAPPAGVLALCLTFAASLLLLRRLIVTYRCDHRP